MFKLFSIFSQFWSLNVYPICWQYPIVQKATLCQLSVFFTFLSLRSSLIQFVFVPLVHSLFFFSFLIAISVEAPLVAPMSWWVHKAKGSDLSGFMTPGLHDAASSQTWSKGVERGSSPHSAAQTPSTSSSAMKCRKMEQLLKIISIITLQHRTIKHEFRQVLLLLHS